MQRMLPDYDLLMRPGKRNTAGTVRTVPVSGQYQDSIGTRGHRTTSQASQPCNPTGLAPRADNVVIRRVYVIASREDCHGERAILRS